MPKIKINKNISLEKAFKRLDEIVHNIEDETITLDKMIALFEEGMLLTKACNKKIKEAEKKISTLINKTDSSN